MMMMTLFQYHHYYTRAFLSNDNHKIKFVCWSAYKKNHKTEVHSPTLPSLSLIRFQRLAALC